MFLQFMFLGLLCECSGVSSWSGSWRQRQLRHCHRLPANILCAPCFATRITQISTNTSDVGPGFSAEAGTFIYGKAANEGTCPTAKAACKREGPCFVGAFVLAFAFDVFFRSVSHDIPVPWLYLISLYKSCFTSHRQTVLKQLRPDFVADSGGSGDGLAPAAEWYRGLEFSTSSTERSGYPSFATWGWIRTYWLMGITVMGI